MQKAAKYVAIGLALVAAACDAPTSSPDLREVSVPGQGDIQVVARSLAMAMQDPQARLAVRDGLRDSPWTEHKLTLDEFLATDGGAAVLNAAAQASGESLASLRSRVDRLPDLDFFVASREQRLTWRGAGEVAVAATLDGDAMKVDGFTSNGRPVADALKFPADAVLLLAPAEVRSYRLEPQPVGVGSTIQSREDGERGDPTVSWTSADGTTITARYSDLVAGKDSRFKPLMNHLSGDLTYVDKIAGFMTDGGSNWLELGVTGTFYAPDGSSVGSASWWVGGIPYNTLVTVMDTLFVGHVIPDNGNARIQATLWEMDDQHPCGNFCGDDDPYGSQNFYWNDRDVVKPVYCSRSVCNNSGNLVGQLSLHWNARSASVLTSLTVAAEDIYVGASGGAYARPADQYGYGLSGYTASWSIADPSVASLTSTSGQSAYYSGNSAGWTTITATVGGLTASDGIFVQTYQPPCDPNTDPLCPW